MRRPGTSSHEHRHPGRPHPSPILSDFAAAEFASVFATLDTWAARATHRAETTPADVAAAGAFLRRLDLPLRTPDALNIAIAQRLGAVIGTFDAKMAAAACTLGLTTSRMVRA